LKEVFDSGNIAFWGSDLVGERNEKYRNPYGKLSQTYWFEPIEKCGVRISQV
jgi:hypothetical protein